MSTIDKNQPPFNPGDVVVLNSSTDIPMTVIECIIQQRDGKEPWWGVNVLFLNQNTQKHERRGFSHLLLSLYKPATDFINPVGYKAPE